jgi:hypothetical protein
MADSTPFGGDNFTFHVHEDGVCEITVEGEFHQATVSAIAQRAQQFTQTGGTLSGFLLDLRNCLTLSLVRLSGLLDILSRMQVPVAVVFLEEQQLELASLLHHTLVYRDYVAYFTTMEGAWLFLRGPD